MLSCCAKMPMGALMPHHAMRQTLAGAFSGNVKSGRRGWIKISTELLEKSNCAQRTDQPKTIALGRAPCR